MPIDYLCGEYICISFDSLFLNNIFQGAKGFQGPRGSRGSTGDKVRVTPVLEYLNDKVCKLP